MSTIALVAAVWLVGYVIACAVWPYRRCGRCLGTGKSRSPSGKAWRPCGSCDGGTKVRLGRRVAEWWSR